MGENNASGPIVESGKDVDISSTAINSTENNKAADNNTSVEADNQAVRVESDVQPAGVGASSKEQHAKIDHVGEVSDKSKDDTAKSDEQKSEIEKNRDFQNKMRNFRIRSSDVRAEQKKREYYRSRSVKLKEKSKAARQRNNKKRSSGYGRRNGF